MFLCAVQSNSCSVPRPQELLHVELEMLKVPLRLRHEARHLHEAIEQQMLADLKARLRGLNNADER